MQQIDTRAYTNNLRSIDPAQKVLLAGLLLFLCLLLDRPLVHLAAIGWSAALVIGWASIPAHTFFKLLGAEAAFLLLTAATVAIQLQTPPIPASGWLLGPFLVTPAGFAQSGLLLTRTLGCTAALNFLILTTPVADLIELGWRWKLSPVLIELLVLVYRFIVTLWVTLQKMVTAQESRLGYSSPTRSFRSAGAVAMLLFVESYRRSCRMEQALQSRAYTGTFRVLPPTYLPTRKGYSVALLLSTSLLLIAWISG